MERLGTGRPGLGAVLPAYFQGLAVGLGVLVLLALAYEFVLPAW